jgi:hypothetical protein
MHAVLSDWQTLSNLYYIVSILPNISMICVDKDKSCPWIVSQFFLPRLSTKHAHLHSRTSYMTMWQR